MNTNKLTGRAKFYARYLSVLSREVGIGGRLLSVDRAARYLNLAVRLSNPLQIDAALKLASPLAIATSAQVVIAQRERGLILYQFELATGYWQTYTRADLEARPGRVGLGLAEAKRQIDFMFDPPHALVAGTTGSGKTEAVRSALCGLFTAYSPDELQAVIVDPNHDYQADFRNVLHLRGLPIATRGNEIDRVLTYANQQLRQRKENNLRNERRLVVVVDEAEEILHGKRLGMVTSIAKGGRGFNVNLIVATQKPTETTLPNLVDKLNNRFVGLVADGRVSAYLTGRAGLECHKLTGKGDFVHVAGTEERLLVAMATRTDLERLPRGEMSPPEIEGADGDVGDDEDEDPRGPGRPPTEIEPELIAYYLWYGPEQISQRIAREVLGLGRPTHYKHRAFAQAIKDELIRLRSKNGR
jgi:hypothetical protein